MSRPRVNVLLVTPGVTSMLWSPLDKLAGRDTYSRSFVDAFHEANPCSVRVVEHGHVYHRQTVGTTEIQRHSHDFCNESPSVPSHMSLPPRTDKTSADPPRMTNGKVGPPSTIAAMHVLRKMTSLETRVERRRSTDLPVGSSSCGPRFRSRGSNATVCGPRTNDTTIWVAHG